jgi:hypothetical protein
VPVGIVGLLLTWRLIPSVEPDLSTAPDLTGMTLVGTSLTAIMIGVETAGRGLLPSFVPELCVAIGVFLFYLTVRHCRRVPNPAINFSLLRIPSFHASTIAGSLFRVGAGALPFLVPLTLQLGFGLSASRSGMISLASALGSFCMRPMTRFALGWFSVRTVLIAGSVSFAAVLAACATLTPSWPTAAIFILLLLGGLSRSLAFATMGAMCFADVPQEQLSSATSFQGTTQQLTKAVGVAIAASSLQLTMYWSGRSHPGQSDFASAFLLIAVTVLISVPMFAALGSEVGAGLSAARRRGSSGPP